LAAIWIWAAVEKLGSPRTFVQTVRAYDATPEWLSKAIGYGLPVVELCVGILLAVGVAVRLAAAISAVLFLVFLIGLVQAAARGIQLECGCFGGGGVTAGATSYTLDILRDIGLLVLAAFLIVWSYTYGSIDAFLGRNDEVAVPSAKRMRSEQGQRKYNAMLEEKRKAARERAMWVNASMAVLVVLIGLIGIGVQSSRAKIAGTLTATNASVANGVVFGKKAAATVDVYEDFQCPHCLDFETAVHKQMDADVRANKAQVRFHTLAFLDASSNGNNYSTRAANAALCASDASVDDFVALHNLLFTAAVQPKEGSNGRSNAELDGYGGQVLPKAQVSTYDTCVAQETHKALAEAITERASKDGVNSTPTIKVNGKSISPTLAAWNAAIAAALKNGPAPSPSVTPSPTPTPTPTTSAPSSPAASSTSSSRSRSASPSASKKK
jgi:protein-disulfide isomerase/uncharacterized membrane protein YphA (DoxX/SURF4 family)